MKLRVQVLIAAAIITNHYCIAQSGTYTVGAGVFQGFIYRHTFKMGHLADTYPNGFEVFLAQNTGGEKDWHQRYNYPDVGVSIGYNNYRSSITGQTISALSFIDFYLNKKRKRHNFKLRIGGGLGFNTQPFDLESNNKNNALGSTVTLGVQFRATYELITNNQWKVGIGPNLTHFSNGAVKLPNLGINVASLFFIVSKQFGPAPTYIRSEEEEKVDGKLRFNIAIFTGLNENEGSNGQFPFISINSYVDKRLNFKSALNAGIDLFYSLALKEQIKGDPKFANSGPPDFKQIGLTIGHELFISRVSLLTQIGVYIYKPYVSVEPVYQRIGIKIYANNRKFYGGVNLKTHYATAELVELGMGARFR